MDFLLHDDGYRYRPLRLLRKRQVGWDVFALQTGLQGVGLPLAKFGADGTFGLETSRAVKNYQGSSDLVVDGIAGVVTQRQIALELCLRATKENDLPHGIPYGHAEYESSFLLGNYTPPYPNGSRDCGVVQRNTQFTPAKDGFTVPVSIAVLGWHVRSYHDKYIGWGVANPRAWRLACGSWNAPSWTDRLARGETLTASALQHITSYIDAVTVYAVL